MIPSLEFGRTGHRSSRILFGAAALWNASPEQSAETLQNLLVRGVNHIDVANGYGPAELRVGESMPRLRKRFFLATKTGKRDHAGAWRHIERSLQRLQTDRIDLIQLHNLSDEPGWQMAFSEDGALRALCEARPGLPDLALRRRRSEALGGVERQLEEAEIAGAVDEDAGPRERPVHRAGHVVRIAHRSIPGVVRALLAGSPAARRDRLDRLHRDPAPLALGVERLEVRGVLRLAHHRRVVGREHRVERKPRQAAQVHRRHCGAVAGDADESHQALIARFAERAQGAVLRERHLPARLVGQVVELDQVDPVRLQPLEGALEVPPGAGVVSFAGLGGEKEALAQAGHRFADAKLGGAVPVGDVDVIHAASE